MFIVIGKLAGVNHFHYCLCRKLNGGRMEIDVRNSKMTNRELERKAGEIRKTLLETIHNAKSGHIGGSMSIADILSVLYFDVMNVDPTDPKKVDRDRLVLSKGHCSPALYATLALKGFFPMEKLKDFRRIDTDMSGHVEMHVPGIDMSTGSLGQGLSVALGMAMCAKAKGYKNRVYAILGDGEIQEGQIWEAAMAASFYHTGNLTALIDNNGMQLDGRLEEVMNPLPIAEKFRAFGWNAIEINGHSIQEIRSAIELSSEQNMLPTAIICHTIKGKGVSIFEDQVRFHGGQPTSEEWDTAFREIINTLHGLED